MSSLEQKIMPTFLSASKKRSNIPKGLIHTSSKKLEGKMVVGLEKVEKSEKGRLTGRSFIISAGNRVKASKVTKLVLIPVQRTPLGLAMEEGEKSFRS